MHMDHLTRLKCPTDAFPERQHHAISSYTLTFMLSNGHLEMPELLQKESPSKEDIMLKIKKNLQDQP